MKRLFLYIITLLAIATEAMADKVGTWKLYPSYTNITEVQYTKADSSEVFVLAGGNLFAYYNSDHTFSEFMIEGAESATGTSFGILSDREISHIAWCATVRKLVIVYSDGMIDVLNAKDRSNPVVGSVVGLKETSLFSDKSVTSIYVKGQYAYLQTSAHIIKIDVKDEYIVQIYNTTDITLVDGLTSDNLVEPVTLKYKYGSATVPDGPKINQHCYLKIHNGVLYALPGQFDYTCGGGDNTEGIIQKYYNSSWSYADNSGQEPKMFINIDFDPLDANHSIVSSPQGMYEYENDKLIRYYKDGQMFDLQTGTIGTCPLANNIVITTKFDPSGNLWIFNRYNSNLLCLKKDKSWASFPVSSYGNIDRYVYPFFDSSGMLWFVNQHYNPFVIGFFNPNTGVWKVLNTFVNQDGTSMPHNTYTSGQVVRMDLDGRLWLGASDFIAYLTPENIEQMRGSTTLSDITFTQPKVNRDDGTGLADYLLDRTYVTDIEFDKLGRMYVATYENGIYIINADLSQAEHFTKENSVLVSNSIKSMTLDENTGRLFIGSLNGLCSYQTDVDANSGELSKDNVYAYPNPVTPEYNGNITIMGLTNGCSLKITNTAGQIVHSGTCKGGFYTWNGCDGTGKRVATGVYMVLVSNAEGDDGCVTKIAVVK